MKLILLSSEGERHEDRIPEGIFSSLDSAINWILKKNPDHYVVKHTIQTDYDNEAIDIYVYHNSWNISDDEKECEANFIAESFYLDKSKGKS